MKRALAIFGWVYTFVLWCAIVALVITMGVLFRNSEDDCRNVDTADAWWCDEPEPPMNFP